MSDQSNRDRDFRPYLDGPQSSLPQPDLYLGRRDPTDLQVLAFADVDPADAMVIRSDDGSRRVVIGDFGRAVETDYALPIRVVGGAPSPTEDKPSVDPVSFGIETGATGFGMEAGSIYAGKFGALIGAAVGLLWSRHALKRR